MTRLYKKFKIWMNYNPPSALSSRGWALFKKEFKEKAPIRYWLKYRFSHKTILPLRWRYEKITDWLLYRTTRRYHVVRTGLPPGYYDLSEKLLHTNFTMLVDFVEVEQAWHNYICNGDLRKNESWVQRNLPFFRHSFRRPDLGIKYLEWAATLDDPLLPPAERCDHQAVAARETLALYDWWVNKRPARAEVKFPSMSRATNDDIFGIPDMSAEDHKIFADTMAERNKQDKEWLNEDTEMLIRLIKIRQQLWT